MIFTKKKLALAVAVTLGTGIPLSAFATNGMNLEGYGPVATGMGGASMAYDNGTAAVMNNPATLGLMPEGNRVDVAVGMLGPNITSKLEPAAGFPAASSSADAFYMPAIGWAQKSGQMAYGVGIFGQGGMGTEYGADSFLAAGSNETVRSEVSVGRLIAPFAYNVNDKISLAGSIDFVWAGMDLKMALSGAQFLDMTANGSQSSGTVSGNMMTTFNQFVGMGVIASGMGGAPAPVNWGRFDFSNGSDFTGEATGEGFAGKLGGTFKVDDQLSLGASYHSATSLSDLETSNATVTFNANVDPGAMVGAPTGSYTAMTIPVKGKISVVDFEWPQMFGLGAAYKVDEKLTLVADYKWINWADAMKNFKMTFTADATQDNQLAQQFAGTTLDATMYQNWDDQNVIMLGGSYKFTDLFTLRAGANFASNPIPDQYVNPLFPATIENHYTLGGGFNIDQASTVDVSMTYAPKVEARNPGANASTTADDVIITHSQFNWQLMYSYRF